MKGLSIGQLRCIVRRVTAVSVCWMNIAVSSCVGGADTYRPGQQPEVPQHPVVAVEYDDEDACSPLACSRISEIDPEVSVLKVD